VVLFSFIMLQVPVVQAPTWTIQTVDSSINDVGWFTSIALDSTGKPHISYYDDTDEDIQYAKWTGSTWSLETADTCTYNLLEGYGTSIALDSNNNPHITYERGALMYAKKIGSTWYIEDVDHGILNWGCGAFSSIKLDSNNYPHISHVDRGSLNVKYAQWTGSNWLLESVQGSGYSGFYLTSLALDSNDKPHMTFYHGMGSEPLTYAHKTGATWQTEVVASGIGDTLFDVSHSIALDSANRPHICYNDASTGNLKYMKWTGTSWAVETIDWSLNEYSAYCSMALDYKDRPHISYYDQQNRNLKYAWWTGSSWSVETVDSPGFVGEYTSIAVNNADGSVHISYYDETNGNLKYATTKIFTPPGPYLLPGAIASTPALVCDGYENHMVVRGMDNGIYYMRTDYMGGGGWSGTWTKIPGSTCDEPALAIMGSDLHLVVRGMDNSLYHKIMDINTGVWGNWIPLGGSTTSAPTFISSTSNSLALVVRGCDDGIYYNSYIRVPLGGGLWLVMWTGWTNLQGATIDKPALVSDGSTLTLAVRGKNNGIYVKAMDLSSGVWSSWIALGGATSSGPAVEAAPYEDDFVLAVRGLDNKIYYTYTYHGEWSGPWFNLPGVTVDRPVLGRTSYGDELLHLVVRGSDNGIYHNMWEFSTTDWSGWTRVAGNAASCPGLTDYYDVALELVYRDTSNKIWYNTWSSGSGW
jgi:hypothetical protein